ncbi:MAG: sigma-54-dependent Fis family transcriptional regulator [Hydrogenophaga sp.]|nr:sigma-54-dependent Fis family transcriptional regulator [Hydrogenophaga sp.]
MTAPSPACVLVVDDEPDLRTLYELTLLREGHEVISAPDLAQARDWLAQRRFDVLITDMRLPDGLGLELLRELGEGQRSEKTIVITAYGSAENAVEALKSGAFDYLTKPVDLKQLRTSVIAAIQSQRHDPATTPRGQASAGSPRVSPPPPGGVKALSRIVGVSPAMQQIRQRIEKVATSMAPVLILGESGTGKELVARAVHECSHRSGGPFVAVNCGAIPDNLIEAEFFGARKGAYTGATHDREGYFQASQGGTLFLDEIGDLPLGMQAKLLRVIQERRVRPLGGVQEEAVDVRLVSATHKDLSTLVHKGEFRQDLFYRLNVIEVKMPPLRERREDLPSLVEALLRRISQESGQVAPVLSTEAMTSLQARELPGNVRELENLLQRALALSTGDVLEAQDFGDPGDALPPGESVAAMDQAPSISPPAPDQTAHEIPDDLQSYLDEQERQVLLKALKECDFNRTAAASRLGLNLRQIRYRIQRLGITMPSDDEDTSG